MTDRIDISQGVPAFATEAERTAYHTAIDTMIADCQHMEDAAKREQVIKEIKTALAALGVAVGAATGLGLIPAAVLPFIGIATGAADGIVKAIESAK